MSDQNLKSLFLAQGYNDCYEDYINTLNYGLGSWDYVVITTATLEQRKYCEAQINERLERSFLCEDSKFMVMEDQEEKAIGSGGATLNVLSRLNQECGIVDFATVRVLLIHAGGNSRQMPQFSTCGRLFSPVPRQYGNGMLATLFDEIIISTSALSSRISGGMLVMSGDSLVLFNPLQIDFQGHDALALSVKVPAGTAEGCRVFVTDNKDNMQEVVCKLSPQTLAEKGAVDDLGNVDISTGATIFSGKILNSMLALISKSASVEEGLKKFANDKSQLSLAKDIMYILAGDGTLDDYLAVMPGGKCDQEILESKQELYKCLATYKLSVAKLSPAGFIKCSTSKEHLQLFTEDISNYSHFNWKTSVGSFGEGAAMYNAVCLTSTVGKSVLLENSIVNNCTIGDNVILSNVELFDLEVPSDTVWQGIKTASGYVAASYGINDNPCLASKKLLNALMHYGITNAQAPGCDMSLWDSKIYIPADTAKAAAHNAVKLAEIMAKTASKAAVDWYFKQSRVSLHTSVAEAEVDYNLAFSKEVAKAVAVENAVKAVKCQDIKTFEKILAEVDAHVLVQVLGRLSKGGLLDLVRAKAFAYSIIATEKGGAQLPGLNYFTDIQKALETTPNAIVVTNKCQDITVEMPIRVNFGGGWTDTPPYCIEHGGTVLNAAVKLKGQNPIVVTVAKYNKPCIKLICKDINQSVEIYDDSEILSTISPYDNFALHKACIATLGLISSRRSIAQLVSTIGCGISIESDVLGIPRGSGLGTSSILVGCCVKAILQFFGNAPIDDEIYEYTLLTEQLMSTGGGWQDQVGGITSGIKLITSPVGIPQKLAVGKITMSAEGQRELGERFALIFTGQRRLARNLLREVMNNYLVGNPDSLTALREIERIALVMARELERGDIDAFAELMNDHWKYSKMLDKGTTNTCIEQIFRSIDPLIAGKMICGAGGGGFLQVVLKKGVKIEQVKDTLSQVFGKNVAVWASEFVH